MMKLAVYGAGGMGRETMLLMQQINSLRPVWDIVGFFDDGKSKGNAVGGWKILGGMQDINNIGEGLAVVVGIADPATRRDIVSRIKSPFIQFPVVIHPACQTGDRENHFGRGTILTAGVVLTTGIHLDEFVIVNLNSTIGHDCFIGKFSAIMPGCNISGNVRIGESTLLGTGCKILQNLSVGSHCKVGAGAVVTRDFGDNKTIVGIPAHDRQQ